MRCTGCGLCAAVCPVKCISMEPGNDFGHLFPKIDRSVCIDCGLCQKSCPTLDSIEKRRPLTAYAAWSKDKNDYKSSSSGGAASVLSQYVLSHGGVVYGCSMLPDIEVKHIRIDDVKDLWKLKGSKYVQSNPSDIYLNLKQDVKEGRLTLFIGTPCQVAAVKSMFNSQPDHLILIDLICHGVPSSKLLKKHVKSIAPYPHYDKIVFRKGNAICIEVIADGNIVYCSFFNKPRYKDFYINAFFDGYIYRESCYSCRYACPDRISDITIGDFWKLGNNIPADDIPDHPYGCSLILPSSEKGLHLIENLSEKLNLYERTVEEAVEGNDQLRNPTPFTNRKFFFRMLYPIIGKSAYKIAVFDKFFKYNLKRFIRRKL